MVKKRTSPVSAATKSSRRRMGITTLISAIFIVASLVWATYNFAIVQSGAVREYTPHYEYDEIGPWPYDIPWAGGRTNWFDNINYTDVPLDAPLPNDIQNHLDDLIFRASPADPPQLWRTEAYDEYDGSSWGKTQVGTQPLDNTNQLISSSEATNPIYTITFNASAGANVGAIELPSLHPDLRVIENSFMTWSIDGSGNYYQDPGRLLDYDLMTDAYNTLLFTPLIQGTTGDLVQVTFNVTYDTQDLTNIATNALPGSSAPGWTDIYLNLPSLTPLVEANISQFDSVGSNAYEKAMAVQFYFQSTFSLTYTDLSRPPASQEVTDWFLQRGGGLPMDFATAYCVFMRQLGVPARLALGYAVGDLDPTMTYRDLKVRHMTFWSEVFIPMPGGGGEWIQVIPASLPDNMGGSEDPTNTPIPNVQLIVWPSNGLPYAQIGTPFGLSAAISVDNVPVTTPEAITFVDETDSVFIGMRTIGQFPDRPIANITYTFPSGTTVDYHIIAATWNSGSFTITNRTSIYAVGTPNPLSTSSPPDRGDSFVLSETRQLNVSQGLDTHIAFWEDTVHVYGTMKVGGVPVNSSNHDNRNIGIYWDNTFMGNATINEYGYYELNIYVDPLDLFDMTVGGHEVWCWYLGDWDQYGIPRLTPARSSNNSTVTVWGRIGFNLNVSPTDVPAGSTIFYDGVAFLLNGTALPASQQVGVFFSSQANATVGLNSTGGFTWSYGIPVTQADGTYFAYANWSSPWPLIAGNWSYAIPINVGSSGTQLSMDISAQLIITDPLYIGENITIFGYLTHVSNGTGIGGRWVDIYWSNGSVFLGSVLTASDGYYELNYTILLSDEGPVEYWSNFTSLEPTLASCESLHRSATVKKFDVSLDPIFVTPNPVFLLQPIDIEGILQISDFPTPLPNELVDFWLQNSTGVYYIGSDMTNSTGGYFYQYTIPLGQATETVNIWANYTSPYYNVYNGESLPEPLDIQATTTLISIQEDFHSYYVNETILLYGNLQFANGTPIASGIVDIYWINSTGTFHFQKMTDSFGYYQMYYNCTPFQDEPGVIDVIANWTSLDVRYADASSSLAPQIQLQRYYLEIAITAPTPLYVDETAFDVQGVLTYLGGAPPLSGEMVYLSYWDGSGWTDLDNPTTNLTGGFLTPLSFATYDEGIVNFRVLYISPNPLNNDTVAYFSITRIKYTINLEVTIDPNPVKQNETLTVHVYTYFAHNGTALSGATVSLYWNNATLPIPWLGDVITNETGQADLYYSGMSWDQVRTGIEVYGVYAGTVFLASNESVHNILTLNQWQTTFTGVNLPVGPYRIGDTVTITGYLEYVSPSVPYGGATVNVTVFGTTNVTLSDGSFILRWSIPGTVSPGFYDLLVTFYSPYPWIASTSFALPQIQIIAPQPQFTAFLVTPTTVYLDQALRITGTVQWDNGTSYANLPLDIYWGDYYGANTVIVNDYLTDGTGDFTIIFDIPDDLGLLTYVQHVWAYIASSGYAASGESPVIPVTVDIYRATITTNVDTTTTYLGGSVTFSGTLQFTNGTPLVGYDIQIWWGGNHLTTLTITDPALGSFSYLYSVPYSNAIGVLSGYALFEPPTIAWGVTDTNQPFSSVTVIERVDVFMDPQPADNSLTRGGTLVVTGHVLNDGGFNADGVTVEVLANGTPSSFTSVTATDGTYSISVTVPGTAQRGLYYIGIQVTSTYHELRNGPTEWTILVYIASHVDVQTSVQSLMPGEHFSANIQLIDDDGIPLNGQSVSIYLGSTHLTNVLLTDASRMNVSLLVPLTWSEGNGIFNITAQYGGTGYINPSAVIAGEGIHVFEDVVFSYTPHRVDPGQPFTIQCTLHDPSGNPIMFRRIRLNYNSTNVFNYVLDVTGTFRHDVPAQSRSIIRFAVVLISIDVDNIQSNTFTINIETTGGNPLQGTDLLIASILLIGAVIAVLAYLYIVRGMFRSPIISRGIDIPTKLRNIKKLADSGKYGASITLAYRTFEQMCGSKMGSERTSSETAREYLDRVLQVIPLDGATVEQFVQTYEEARFSHHEMTRERYEEAVRIFTDLYPRIDSTAPVE
ncbi:MAG: DUF4129 domain-containing protein [Candidatus Thorarchaeota archaeon]|nr:DUF4129 domain-containing protein [Candidatus Thorarchaeota archaeon]